ncbi:hypothetical protein CY34DRAFT_17552 [Suillus luteus UH-Slu-Lm8-n1]|uniref:Uncharacterized protein n=1 Tax=Suillus luteus UH-Slu-Lm8-n1 TaxID=930992 RepID=A0A0C9ZAV5_9AGAM|nr:hypothetical protein CY34DRAFT_17552 [Suillus luteus UH-Slu-Lm8-n1]
MVRTKKAAGLAISKTDWTTELTWQLLTEAEKPENRKTLLGKRKDENTSKDTKIAVFKRIGSVILEDLYVINPDAVGDHVKKHFDYLVNHYKHHAHRLRTTGVGIQDDNTGYDPDEEHFNHYIPTSGPDNSTPMNIKSIWDEIVSKFPFFLDLHRMLSTHPNVTPIVITTGVGPAGKKTLHYQAPSEDEDEHEGHPASPPSQVFSATQMQQFQTLQQALDAASFPTSQSFADPFADSFPSNFNLDSEKENHLPPPTLTPNQVSSKSKVASATPPTRTSKSLLSHDALEKAKQCISKLPKKRTFEDVLTNLQQANLKSINDRARDEINLKKRQLLLEEFKAGIWEVEEYQTKLKELNDENVVEAEPPAKRIQYSPDWDEIE